MSNNDPISDSLDLTPLQPEVLPAASATPASVGDDFEYARSNLVNILTQGERALADMMLVANLSQNPRAYEVLSTLISTLASANKDLLELQKRRKELEREDPSGPSTVNNNLFVGSTADLQRIINEKMKGGNE